MGLKSNKIGRVIYTDDKKAQSQLYIESIERDFDVSYIRVVESIEWYRDRLIDIGPSVIVQDVMMPSPSKSPSLSIDISAGLRLLEGLKDTIIEMNIGVVVFSDRQRIDLEPVVKEIGFPDALYCVHFKPETGFDDLAQIVREMHFRPR